MNNFGRFILMVVSCVLLVGMTGCAKKSARTTKLTVAGEATTRVEPDTATLTIAVVTQSGQALIAQQENARKSKAVADAVKGLAASAEVKTVIICCSRNMITETPSCQKLSAIPRAIASS